MSEVTRELSLHSVLQPLRVGQHQANGIDAGAAGVQVAGPGVLRQPVHQNVISGIAVENVVAAAAIQRVVAGPAIESITAGAAVEGVAPCSTVQRVRAARASDD